MKLVDFGLSSTLGSERRRSGTAGVPRTRAGGRRAALARERRVRARGHRVRAAHRRAAGRTRRRSLDGLDGAQAAPLAGRDRQRASRTIRQLARRRPASWSSACARAGPRRCRPGVMTFLMSDIEGSTRLWESAPGAMAESLVRHDELIADVVEAHGGHFVKSMGEGDSHDVGVRIGGAGGPRGDRSRARARRCDVAGRRADPGSLRPAHRARRSEREAACTSARPLNLAARVRGEAPRRRDPAVGDDRGARGRGPAARVLDRRPRPTPRSRASSGRRRSRRSPAQVSRRRRRPPSAPIAACSRSSRDDRQLFFGREAGRARCARAHRAGAAARGRRRVREREILAARGRA